MTEKQMQAEAQQSEKTAAEQRKIWPKMDAKDSGMKSRQLHGGIWQSRYAGASRKTIDLFYGDRMVAPIAKAKHSDDKAYHLTTRFF